MNSFDQPSQEELMEMAHFLEKAEDDLCLKTGELCDTSTVMDYLIRLDGELTVLNGGYGK